MPDNLSKEDRIRTMRSVKSQKTSPERRLRAMLAGCRIKGWHVNPKEVTGKPDIAFVKNRIAIFVDGCFWHGCPICNRPLPETNRDYWEKKVNGNIKRDEKYTAGLEADGWRVLRIWEHRLAKKERLDPIINEIKTLLET